jgi:hypothetical protein
MLHFNAVPGTVNKLLLELAPSPALTGFALGGGTSLALRFGHRLSVDLDYFTLAEFLPDEVFDQLRIEDALEIGKAKNTLSLEVNGVKLDLLRHHYPLLSPIEYLDGISMISLPDVAAMKLNAIANRGSKKDFYDLVELMNYFSIKELIGFFTAKYQNADAFSVIRSLGWFEDGEMDPDPISLNGKTWAEVKAVISKVIAKL